MAGAQSEWLKSTLAAVRELMVQRLEKQPLDAETERDIQMALEELEVMWEELQGQAELLQKESERYQEFFDYAPDAYVVTDAGCSVREANRAALELLQTGKASLLGHPFSDFVSESDRTAFLSRFIGLVLEPAEKAITWRCRLQRPDRTLVPVTISVRAIPLRKSGIAGLCWLVRPD
jgi:PAS domain S-box-containing protein